MKNIPVVLNVEYVGQSSIETFQATIQSLVRRAELLGLSIKLKALHHDGHPFHVIIHADTEMAAAGQAAKIVARECLKWE